MQWTEVARMAWVVRVTHGQTPCSLLCPAVSIQAVPTSHGRAWSEMCRPHTDDCEKETSLFSHVLRPAAQSKSRSQTSAGAMAMLHHPYPLPQPRLLQKLYTGAILSYVAKALDN